MNNNPMVSKIMAIERLFALAMRKKPLSFSSSKKVSKYNEGILKLISGSQRYPATATMASTHPITLK